jgi:hypothetical protein
MPWSPGIADRQIYAKFGASDLRGDLVSMHPERSRDLFLEWRLFSLATRDANLHLADLCKLQVTLQRYEPRPRGIYANVVGAQIAEHLATPSRAGDEDVEAPLATVGQ